MLSGGWDRTIKIWDIRKGGPVGHIFGPELSSDALDIHENTLVTGSFRPKNSLQFWDWRMCKRLSNIDWEYGLPISENSYLNFARFNINGDGIIAGGKSQEVKVFDRVTKDDGTHSDEWVQNSRLGNFGGSLFCCATMHETDHFAVGCGDGTVKIYTVNTSYS